MKKHTPSYLVIELTERFIRTSKNGHRRYGNGRRISAGTIENYEFLLRHLKLFEQTQSQPLRIISEVKLNKKQFVTEKRYWKKFFSSFTSYLHSQGCFDNYVGMMMKNLRAVMQYAQDEYMIATSGYRKLLYVTKEEIPVITLLPDRLQFLIHDHRFRQSLSHEQETILDILIVGCTVALRFSDLIGITKRNIERVGDCYYLSVSSIKTGITTRVKLPDYALEILGRNIGTSEKRIFPSMSLHWFNLQLRALCEKAGWIEECGKFRLRNGKRVEIKSSKTGKSYRFCDLISSHVMRRSAITTMLIHGVPEMVVRKISGHSPTSAAFQRYVNLVQTYLDNEMSKHFSQLADYACTRHNHETPPHADNDLIAKHR